jgi:1-acyl-sn-glycerol-3-phosphate acyltransferase
MLYPLAKVVARPLLRVLYHPGIEGARHVPVEGPVILASNHLSGADTVFLPAQLDRTVHFLAKADFFTDPGIPARILAVFLRSVGVIPLDRAGGHASDGALDAGLGVLARGEVLGIYPEGTRSPDGRLYRGRTGAVRLALASGAPIVPVAMSGTREVLEGRRFLPRRRPTIHARLGAPVDLRSMVEDPRATLEDHRAVRDLTDLLMRRIGELSGQEYVDVYAHRVGGHDTGRHPDAHGPGTTHGGPGM